MELQAHLQRCQYESPETHPQTDHNLNHRSMRRTNVCVGHSLAIQTRYSFERFWLRNQGDRNAEKIRLQLDEHV